MHRAAHCAHPHQHMHLPHNGTWLIVGLWWLRASSYASAGSHCRTFQCAASDTHTPSTTKMPIPTRKLGSSNLEVPVLCLGTSECSSGYWEGSMAIRSDQHGPVQVLMHATAAAAAVTWGEQNTEAEAHEQLDYALAQASHFDTSRSRHLWCLQQLQCFSLTCMRASQGLNFIDVAELYPVPSKPETCGRTGKRTGTTTLQSLCLCFIVCFSWCYFSPGACTHKSTNMPRLLAAFAVDTEFQM